MNPVLFYKCLSDNTRLKSLLLIVKVGEICVCDLMSALQLDQPKISRHLAELRKQTVLLDERRGKWVYYRLHPDLPTWAKQVLHETLKHNAEYLHSTVQRVQNGKDTCC